LADAGYAGGKGFPKIVLEVNRGHVREMVALEVQKQLKVNLNKSQRLFRLLFLLIVFCHVSSVLMPSCLNQAATV